MGQQPHLAWESRLWAQGYFEVAGLDEAGRGAWAGPVVAAAVVLPADDSLLQTLALVRDSKLMTPRQRDLAYDLVRHHALSFSIGACSACIVDRVGIVPATKCAMRQAIEHLAVPPGYLLIDAVRLPEVPIPQCSRPKGDRYCLSIAAASVVAKVTRDRWMVALDQLYPHYAWDRNKGYGTAQHHAALRALGSTTQHRHTYAPVRVVDETQHAQP